MGACCAPIPGVIHFSRERWSLLVEGVVWMLRAGCLLGAPVASALALELPSILIAVTTWDGTDVEHFIIGKRGKLG